MDKFKRQSYVGNKKTFVHKWMFTLFDILIISYHILSTMITSVRLDGMYKFADMSGYKPDVKYFELCREYHTALYRKYHTLCTLEALSWVHKGSLANLYCPLQKYNIFSVSFNHLPIIPVNLDLNMHKIIASK